MLPRFFQTLKWAGKIDEFMEFNRLLSEDKFPLTNIAFLLFLDIMRWYSLYDGTIAMRFSGEVKEFWRTGPRLFHRRLLWFIGGPKNRGQIFHKQASPGPYQPEEASLNFVVPDRRVWVDEQKLVENSKPGILYNVVEKVSMSDPNHLQTFKICVDG